MPLPVRKPRFLYEASSHICGLEEPKRKVVKELYDVLNTNTHPHKLSWQKQGEILLEGWRIAKIVKKRLQTLGVKK